MRASRLLRWARLTAGLSQRELAAKAGIPQSTVARVESGRIDPRVRTLSRLLRACGYDLEAEPRLGQGVDRTLIRAMLAISPAERVQHLSQEARVLDMLENARQKRRQTGLRRADEG